MGKHKMTLKTWLNSLPRLEYKQVRINIIEACGFSVAVWNHTFQEKTVPSIENQKIINKIAGKELDYLSNAKHQPLHQIRANKSA